MSLDTLSAWIDNEQEVKNYSAVLLKAIQSKRKDLFSRKYDFARPIVGCIAELSEKFLDYIEKKTRNERGLAEITMQEKLKAEKNSPLRRLTVFGPIAAVLYLAFVMFSGMVPQQRETIMRGVDKVYNFYPTLREGFIAQVKIPKAIWIASGDLHFARKDRSATQIALDEPNSNTVAAPVPENINQQSLDVGKKIANLTRASVHEATAIRLIGTATANGKPLLLHDTIAPGSTLTTGPRSFVNLLFPDNTQLGVTADTTMKIEPTKRGEPSVVGLATGELRAIVSKDLQHKDGDEPKEKFIIKTKSAAMGVRGTDFHVTYSAQNEDTKLVTLEGSVAMSKLEHPTDNPILALRTATGVQMVSAGMSSHANPTLATVSAPETVPAEQLETLKANVNMLENTKQRGQYEQLHDAYSENDTAAGQTLSAADTPANPFDDLEEEPSPIDKNAVYEWVTVPPPALKPDAREFPDVSQYP